MDLKAPPLLRTLIETGRWKHPGDHVLRRAIPFLVDPVDFCTALPAQTVAHEVKAFMPRDMTLFRLYRDGEPARSLPWLNADRAVFIALNRTPGDDVAIALDYRFGGDEPIVVASRWGGDACEWVEVAPTFADFARLLGLQPSR